jgi:hypothetical protein
MPSPRFKVTKETPPSGYSMVGFFKTISDVNKWCAAAKKAGHEYPFWVQEKGSLKEIGKKYVLWMNKPRKGKMMGKGFR